MTALQMETKIGVATCYGTASLKPREAELAQRCANDVALDQQ